MLRLRHNEAAPSHAILIFVTVMPPTSSLSKMTTKTAKRLSFASVPTYLSETTRPPLVNRATFLAPIITHRLFLQMPFTVIRTTLKTSILFVITKKSVFVQIDASSRIAASSLQKPRRIYAFT